MFFKKNKDTIDFNNLPLSIGIIMDGNGRWAKKRGLPRSAGHRAGAETLRKIVEYCDKIG
ncbi:MAG: undecaprenyl diphosphate synthase family protein, partial [Clostridia bacterium]|nr:undecaprenyl diphosphate synthase family protein [Clostridia bacterium]